MAIHARNGGECARLLLLAAVTCLTVGAAAVSHAGEARWPAGKDSVKSNRERMEPPFRGVERAMRIVNSTYWDYILEFRGSFVRVTGIRESVGETLRVSRKPIAVEALSHGTRADLTITELFGSFFGVSGDHLFVTSGTCPCPQGLIVYDVRTVKKVLDETYMDGPDPPTLERGRWLTYVEPIGEVDSDDMALWPDPPCPEARQWIEHGLGVGYEEEVVVDLQTLRKVRSGKIRCGARQQRSPRPGPDPLPAWA